MTFLNCSFCAKKSLNFLSSTPDEYKNGKSPGAVEAIAVHPNDADRLIIGYAKGLIVEWNACSETPVQCCHIADQEVSFVSIL